MSLEYLRTAAVEQFVDDPASPETARHRYLRLVLAADNPGKLEDDAARVLVDEYVLRDPVRVLFDSSRTIAFAGDPAAARSAYDALLAEYAAGGVWQRFDPNAQPPEPMDAADFIAKVDWEGGVMGALEYGLTAYDTDDPELARIWGEIRSAYDNGGRPLRDLIAEYERYARTVGGR